MLLRGGKEAIRSNRLLASIVRDSLVEAGGPEEAVQFVDSTDRALVDEMLEMKGIIDLMVPRGSEDFIRYVDSNASMPVVAGGVGVCHTYVGQLRRPRQRGGHSLQCEGTTPLYLQRPGHPHRALCRRPRISTSNRPAHWARRASRSGATKGLSIC